MAVDVDRVISSLTLAGSALSCLATTFVLISFTIYRRHLRSFRHVLVLNLVVAEFVNTLNNSVSGIIFLKTGELQPGTPCVVNGMVGQFSVQAADFSILAIALVTLLTVTRFVYMPGVSTKGWILTCLSVWTIPLITSLTPTLLGEMVPVGGNWCWISAGRPDLRYGMGHGWRFLVIFSTIGVYIYIWAYLRRHLGSKPVNQRSSSYDTPSTGTMGSFWSKCGRKGGFQVMKDEEVELSTFGDGSNTTNSQRDIDDDKIRSSNKEELADLDLEAAEGSGSSSTRPRRRSTRHMPSATRKELGLPIPENAHVRYDDASPVERHGQGATLQTNASEFPIRRDTHEVEVEIKRMMLLNAYPFMYVLLWMPGLINRLMEASGHSTSKTTIAALQISTQYIGLANALTYGFNHHLRDRLKGMYLTPAISRIKKRFGR
ncbi:Git3 domain-containing protein [Fusarium falciforme]|uniref:Git3 domain-containing protein n=1 Tax=Fusarium falciforme TaxID=195108 RepID=UPI0023015DE5|nr:Git3 domain-containing protein [Fusarium falciforme]WAO95428.1 Git3 domain-containing protein [Fusarium falciforme]